MFKVFCGHEYSLQNLGYGEHVEPDNKVRVVKVSWATSCQRDDCRISVRRSPGART